MLFFIFKLNVTGRLHTADWANVYFSPNVDKAFKFFVKKL